jgi:hypothetical protein
MALQAKPPAIVDDSSSKLFLDEGYQIAWIAAMLMECFG